MSRRALSLPVRLATPITPRTTTQWQCRRCLATQAAETTSTASFPPVPNNTLQQTVPQASPTPSPDSVSSNAESSNNWSSLNPREQLLQRIKHKYEAQAARSSIPIQQFQHASKEKLTEREREMVAKTHVHKDVKGVVVSAGKMDRTVKVRVPGQRWEKKIGKYYPTHTDHLVHDRNSSVREGDVVVLHRLRVSKTVHHVVASIAAPFGTPVEDRPPIPSPDERLEDYRERRRQKVERQILRKRAEAGDSEAVHELKSRGVAFEPVVEETSKGKGGNKKAVGSKGQPLPDGVLPGGKHAVGTIDGRAKHNKEKAMKLDEKTADNLAEAEELEAVRQS